MKKLLAVALVIGAVSCSNPEENATTPPTTDTGAKYQESNTINTPPGAVSPDTSGGSKSDTSHAPQH